MSVGPSGECFQFVVVLTEVGEVVERGRTVAGGPFDGVVEFAVGGFSAAAGCPAGFVADGEPAAQRFGGFVAVDGEDGAGDRVGDQPDEFLRVGQQCAGGGQV